jgi:serine/threonine protein phosphatase PrpC
MTIAIRYAARSDVGQLREGNEDSAYAGPQLLAVADGMGGHAHGEVASAVAIDALKPLDQELPTAELLEALEHAVRQANQTLHQMVESDSALEGMGTTLTAMLWSGKHLALVHVGDSRAYLLRSGELFQITHDHTLVQSLVDEQRITPEEAATHPQRSLLLRALDGRGEVEPDLQLREAQIGDRYLLCSDGLSAVVTAETIHETLTSLSDPEQAVRRLIDLANRGGGPDNITCVVADVVDGRRQKVSRNAPVVAGAAALAGPTVDPNGQMPQDTPAQRAAALRETRPQPPVVLPPGGAGGGPGVPGAVGGPGQPGPGETTMPQMAARRSHRRWIWAFAGLATIVVLIGGGGLAGLRWADAQYFVGTNGKNVVVYRGLAQPVLGFDTKRVHKVAAGLPLSDLPKTDQDTVKGNIPANNAADADSIVANLVRKKCKYTYKVGLQGDQVVMFVTPVTNGCQGKTEGAGISASHLPTQQREALRRPVADDNPAKAQAYINSLRLQAEKCRQDPQANGCKGAGPS